MTKKQTAPATTPAPKGDIDFENELFVQSLMFLQAHGGDKNGASLKKAPCWRSGFGRIWLGLGLGY